jgi:hypothetical protein
MTNFGKHIKSVGRLRLQNYKQIIITWSVKEVFFQALALQDTFD